MRLCYFILPTVLLLVSSACSTVASELDQQVRSLLSNRCFACHGPDAAQRQGGFRLDMPESYLAPADSGEVPITPGDPATSQLWTRICTDDADSRMPPSTFGEALSADEKQLIKSWISTGANLAPHWSFIEPKRPALPSSNQTDEGGVRSHWTQPIDRFVLHKMLQHGLQPSPMAERFELLRRLSLDLVGLPPTPTQVDAFASDRSEDAYERQVDRLLASPAFGEHWARKWLDLARYADSAGYADDPERTIWGYRDWVIRALNDNMPIDQFTVEQLAGDLLPNPTIDQLTATAFHRNTLTNNEGGTNDEEFRNVAIVDRVNTTMAVWMGLTMGCSQCHNHKYDPLSQQDFYRLFAIFNQSQDADRRDESPVIEQFTEQQHQQLAAWRNRILQIDEQLTLPSDSPELAQWESSIRQPQWQRLQPSKFQSDRQSDADIRADGSIRVKPVAKLIWADTQTIELQLPQASLPIQSISIRTIPDPTLPRGGAGLGNGNFVLTDVKAELLPNPQTIPLTKFVRVELPGAQKILALAEVQVFSQDKNIAMDGRAEQSSTAYEGSASRAIDGNTNGRYFEANSTTHTQTEDAPWWEVELAEAVPVERVVVFNRMDNDLQSRLDGAEVVCLDNNRRELFRFAMKKAPKESQAIPFSSVTEFRFASAYAEYSQAGFSASAVIDDEAKSGWAVEGQIDRSHLLSLIPESPIDASGASHLRLTLAFNAPYQDHLLGSYAVEISYDSSTRDWVALSDRVRQIHLTLKSQRSAQEQNELADFFARNFAASTAGLRDEKLSLEKLIAKYKPETSVPIMRELPADQQRKTFVQIRGDYKLLGDQVDPGTPAIFPAIKTTDRPSRLDLAHWLVDRDNPLTARAWVNRIWESLFGLGIVRSSEEFGAQGEAPTHPELLDWLAIELMDGGWDLKSLLRMLVTSQVYQQSSAVSPDLLSLDRDNVWLARGPRVRLSAEMLRDHALMSAGLLSSNMYGPPVQPPQPSLGLNAAFGATTDWTTSQGDDRYRRAIYTRWRRSSPYPALATFDAPSREVCILKRDATNTPLQALVTLNDPVFIEAAQSLARRTVLIDQPESEDIEKVQAIYANCLCRQPVAEELDALLDLLRESREHFSNRPDEAQKLATDPLGPLPPGFQAGELAAWTTICNVIMNLDEMLMKR